MILLVDGNNQAWRAFHAGTKLTYNGRPTGMAFTFLKSLRSAIDELMATGCTVAWDSGASEFRRKIFPEYKSKAVLKDESIIKDFAVQQEWLLKVLPLLGVSSVACDGFEADDVLASMALQSASHNVPATVFSGDRDVWQLVDKDVHVLSPTKGMITLKNFATQTDFNEPKDWLLYRVLTGDAADNIPGVGKVGAKRGERAVKTKTVHELAVKYNIDKKLVERNMRLMNLYVSASVLHSQLAAETVKVRRWPAARNLGQAKKMIASQGMHSVLAKWLSWVKTFEGLV